MNRIKSIFKKYLVSFTYFYKYLGSRIFIAILLSIFVGILDGIGLAMFLPLLQMVESSQEVSFERMGFMKFLVEWIKELGFSISLLSILAFLCTFFFLKGVVRYFSIVYQVMLRITFMKKVRLNLLNSFNNLTYKYFIMADVGRIQNTMTTEADRVLLAITHYFKALEQIVLVFVYVAFAFLMDAGFALLVTLGGLLSNFIYNRIYKLTKEASSNLSFSFNRYQGLIIQHVSHYKYLKATSYVNIFALKLKESIEQIDSHIRKIGILNGLIQSIREPILIFVVATVILLQVTVLDASLGPILISLLFFYRALASLMTMQTFWNNFLGVSGSMNNITALQEDFNGNIESKGTEKFNKFNHNIELHDVNFRYGKNTILKSINLKIKKNRTIAFVGESGSGKTTLVNLLAGLMPITSGRILFDSINYDELDLKTYRNRIGYITQEPVIFNDDIFNNVTFWAEPNKENYERFNKVLEEAAVKSFIETLPDKEKTILGNNGINLSGGQKQRISVARELYKDIDILIMDEATSALDSETEKKVQESIESLKGKYTLIIVAHRLSTIKYADEIVLMKNGEIKSIAEYDSLIKKNKDFKRMVELQKL